MKIDETTFAAMPDHIKALFRKLPNPGSEEVLAAFPNDDKRATGDVKVSAGGANRTVSGSLSNSGMNVTGKVNVGIRGFGDAGSAARFFYTAKASSHDRNDGLQRVSGSDRSHHPTVKPTNLLRYLCRLITPPGGTVLDCFMGSGSTLKAAELEGFSAIGIELDADYCAIARRRIASDAPLFANVA